MRAAFEIAVSTVGGVVLFLAFLAVVPFLAMYFLFWFVAQKHEGGRR